MLRCLSLWFLKKKYFICNLIKCVYKNVNTSIYLSIMKQNDSWNRENVKGNSQKYQTIVLAIFYIIFFILYTVTTCPTFGNQAFNKVYPYSISHIYYVSACARYNNVSKYIL